MIPAQKSRWFNAWFARHAQKRIARSFTRVQIVGLSEAREAVKQGPVLFVSNHTSFWDPLLILWLVSRELGADGFAMMDAKNLRRLPFFRKVGAFGVDLEVPADGARAIRYAAKLLRGERRVVWVFPQGQERPMDERPIVFRPGSQVIARLAPNARVIPVALRYEHANVERPYLLVSVGAALPAADDVEEGTRLQARAVEDLLDDLATRLRKGTALTDGETFLPNTPGRISRWAERMLVKLTRGSMHELEAPTSPNSQALIAPNDLASREREQER